MPVTRIHVLEELLTKARTLNDDSGYDPPFKEETLWDTLVFGLRSDKVRKDAIAKGNSLTFQQVNDLAKTEESAKAKMQAITQGYQAGSVHSVRRKQKSDTPPSPRALTEHTAPVQRQVPLADKHKFQSNSMAVSGVETNTVLLIIVQPCVLNANIAGKQAILSECA